MKLFEFGEWLNLEGTGECQFIHYDNKEKTKATVDIEGIWKSVEVGQLKNL